MTPVRAYDKLLITREEDNTDGKLFVSPRFPGTLIGLERTTNMSGKGYRSARLRTNLRLGMGSRLNCTVRSDPGEELVWPRRDGAR